MKAPAISNLRFAAWTPQYETGSNIQQGSCSICEPLNAARTALMKYLFRQFPDPGSGCGWFPGTILCFNDVVYSYPGWIVPFRKNGSIDRKRVLEAMQIFLISIATLVVFAALLIGIPVPGRHCLSLTFRKTLPGGWPKPLSLIKIPKN